ncbi:glycosyltransferase [Pedomonas mirosovicensis]|uniref:glycosyltransferase n=1 Tax=Pedomonas mirosovicensis TaxID=2908641 RepID=UPI00216A3D75|nr:glycosyltransferase [Pedomonas mirosovicensis]MCH8684176.1 glycosyltransferase [Pedomonas mirosovicensis]
MKILFLTYHFAPYNHIGAVRCVKTAKYLSEMGHSVRVLAAADQPYPPNLPLEVNPDTVRRLRCLNLDQFARQAANSVSSGLVIPEARRTDNFTRKLLRKIYFFYKTILWYPDQVRTWRKPLVKEGREEIKNFCPDIIFASGPPFTPLMAAAQLSRESGIPWVCELRDLWADNANYQFPQWRRTLENRLERRILTGASALITVSDPLADKLKIKYALPVHVVTNGFEESDFPEINPSIFPSDRLNLVYTGSVYRNKQDIRPLLAAIQQVNRDREKVVLHLYGRAIGDVLNNVAAFGMGSSVQYHGTISYKEALAAQRSADAAVFLVWNDPAEPGVYSGKLFEYLGARRPIIGVGTVRSVATDLIIERDAGFVSGDPGRLSQVLVELYERKLTHGRIPDLPASVGVGFTRKEQVEKVASILVDTIGSQSPAQGRG